MANTNEIYLTFDGLNEIKKEIEELKQVKRPKVIEALKEARALGDLSENAEYDAARSDQAELESKIKELEQMIEHAVVIESSNTSSVSIGCKVKIKYVEDDEIEEYTIVGSKEADPFENRISNESPIARAIMGSNIGDKVSVDSPSGKYTVEIIGIE